MNNTQDDQMRYLLGVIYRCYHVVNAAHQLDMQPPGMTDKDVRQLERECEDIVTYFRRVGLL